MSFLLDAREGSYQLASMEPVRSLLSPCPSCGGAGSHPEATPRNPAPCRGTGRLLTRINTPEGQGGPDVLICGHGPERPMLIAVEVKELRELLASADTGRLQAQETGQLQVMLRNYDISYLLWYGKLRCGTDGNLEEPAGRDPRTGRTIWRVFSKNGSTNPRPVKYAYLQAMLIEIEVMGVKVQQVANIQEAARWLGVLHAWWQKPWEDHKFTHTFDDSRRLPMAIPGVSPAELDRAWYAYKLPGIGPDKAIAAGKHFGSIREMVNADEKEWGRVKGIGKVIASSVVKKLNS